MKCASEEDPRHTKWIRGILGRMEGLRNGDALKTGMSIVTVMGKLRADQHIFVIHD